MFGDAQPANWPLSFWGFSCLHLPSQCRCAWITDACCLTQLYVQAGNWNSGPLSSMEPPPQVLLPLIGRTNLNCGLILATRFSPMGAKVLFVFFHFFLLFLEALTTRCLLQVPGMNKQDNSLDLKPQSLLVVSPYVRRKDANQTDKLGFRSAFITNSSLTQQA